MDDARKQQVEEGHRKTLSAFVLRARRVEAHSLAADRDALQKLASVEMKMQFRVGEEMAVLVQRFPPEEQVESAAARVRPLILQGDPVHFAQVMIALNYFSKDSDDDSLKEGVVAVKKKWSRIKPRGKDMLGSSTQIEDAAGNKSDFLSDNELGFGWIYGDVVHADEDRREATKMHGVAERYKAAVPIVARIMIYTMVSLNLLRHMQKTGLLQLDEELFTEDVVVTETEFRSEMRAWFAPVGTPLPPEFGGVQQDTKTAPTDEQQGQ
jgi:hypothetical protein